MTLFLCSIKICNYVVFAGSRSFNCPEDTLCVLAATTKPSSEICICFSSRLKHHNLACSSETRHVPHQPKRRFLRPHSPSHQVAARPRALVVEGPRSTTRKAGAARREKETARTSLVCHLLQSTYFLFDLSLRLLLGVDGQEMLTWINSRRSVGASNIATQDNEMTSVRFFSCFPLIFIS